MQTSEKAIQTATQEGWIKPLAFFYQLKDCFPNNIIYHKRIQACSDRTGVSYKTARKYLRRLLREGLIVDQGKLHWKLIPAKEANQKFNNGKKQYHRCTIYVRKGTLKEIQNKLYVKTIQCAIRQQQYRVEGKDNRLFTRGAEHTGTQGAMLSGSVMLSNKTLARKLCMGLWSIQRLKESLHEDFVIQTERPKFLMNMSLAEFTLTRNRLK